MTTTKKVRLVTGIPLQRTKFTRRNARPGGAFRAPAGWEFTKLDGTARKMGTLSGMEGLRKKSAPESIREVVKASIAASAKLKREISLTFGKENTGLRLRAHEFAHEHKIYTNKDDQKLDESAIARLALHGDMVHVTEVAHVVRKLQHENHHLRAQLAFERDENIVRAPKHTFQRPGLHMTKGDRKASFRTLYRCMPFLRGLWECVTGDDAKDDHEGMDNLLEFLVSSGLKGSGAWRSHRWCSDRLGEKLFRNELIKKRFEKERKKTRIWAPSHFLANLRRGHVGRRSLNSLREFMSGQCYGNAKLLQAKKDAVAYAAMWVPAGAEFTEPIVAEPGSEEANAAMSAAAEHAEKRAHVKLEEQKREEEMIKSQAEKDVEALMREKERKERGEEVAEDEEGEGEEEIPLEPVSTDPTVDRSDDERIAEHFGATGLALPLSVLMIARSVYNVILPGSKSSSFGYSLGCDAKRALHGDRRTRTISAVIVTPKIWGAEEGVPWGKAAIKHAMRNAQSCDGSYKCRFWLGNDHYANLKVGLLPYVQEMKYLRKHGLQISHMYLPLPPILYREEFSIEEKLPAGNPRDRMRAVSGMILGAHGILSMDLSAQNEFAGKSYSTNTASSIFNDTIHKDQSRICYIYELPKGVSLEMTARQMWPKCPAMLDIMLMMNDPALDWAGATVKPAQEPLPTQNKGKGGKRNNAFQAGAGTLGKRGREREVALTEEEKDKTMQWVSPELRRRKFSLASFEPDVDGRAADAATCKGAGVRLVRLPFVPAFASGDLPEVLGGDSEVVHRWMALCVLHAEMRMCENILMTIEDPLRQRMGSGGGKAAAEDFNAALNEVGLQLRHQIKINPETNTVYKAAVDGNDAKRLRDDWLKLRDLPCEQFKRSGDYPSQFFSALHAACKKMGCDDAIEHLPKIAEAVAHYACAMRSVRLMPAEMKEEMKDDEDAVYREFEEQARLHCAKWIELGHEFKAYGFHLWANLAHLFRQWGCLELISQQGMEGTVGKLGRLLPHIQLKPCGRYTKAVKELGKEAMQKVLEARRAALASPAKKIYEEFAMEIMELQYEHLPSKAHDSRYCQREILIKIDQEIAADRVLTGTEYTGYWQRYLAGQLTLHRLLGRAKCTKARASYTNLLKEHADYYRGDGLPAQGTSSEEDWTKQKQNARKLRYARLAKEKSLAYQRLGL